MTLPKCCMTCAFCYQKIYKESKYFKNEDTAIRLNSINDAENALSNNWDFIDRHSLEYQNWLQEYERLKHERLANIEQEEAECKKVGKLFPAYSIMKQRLQSDLSDYKDLGMKRPPFGPIKDVVLCCHEKNFIDIKSSEIPNKPMLVNEFPCDFYFPIEERGEKDFEACKKQRDINKQISRDKIEEQRLKIELENTKEMQIILNETKNILQKTDEKITNIIDSIKKTNDLTNKIADYTNRNEAATEKQFKTSQTLSNIAIGLSALAILIALATLYTSCQSSKSQENILNAINKKHDTIIKTLKTEKIQNIYSLFLFQEGKNDR